MTASIWVDADACPNVIKEILFRAAERTGVTVTLVANRPLAIPRVPSLRMLQVAEGFDVADKQIVERSAETGDLVITADIPLAAQIIAKGGEALNYRAASATHLTRSEGFSACATSWTPCVRAALSAEVHQRSRRRIATPSRATSISGSPGGRRFDGFCSLTVEPKLGMVAS